MDFSLSCQCGETITFTEGAGLDELRRLAGSDALPRIPSVDDPQPPPRPLSTFMADLLTVCGALVFVLGVLLFLGNRSGVLPTLPCAGFVVMTIGAVIFSAARARARE